jgi:hypothetical protein
MITKPQRSTSAATMTLELTIINIPNSIKNGDADSSQLQVTGGFARTQCSSRI